MAETKLVGKPEATVSESTCSHHFGFLSQRAKGAAIPEECFTCDKMLDCMVSKNEIAVPAIEIKEVEPEEITVSELDLEVAEPAEETIEEPTEMAEEAPEEAEVTKPTSDVLNQESEPVYSVEKVDEPLLEDKQKLRFATMPKVFKEQVTKRVGQIFKQRIPRLNVQVESGELTGKTISETPKREEFCVGSPGALYNLWSGTIIMNKETLGSWGKKIREVELETKTGRVTICKAFGTHELSLTTIQVPTKIKATLHIEDGAYVKVRPLTS